MIIDQLSRTSHKLSLPQFLPFCQRGSTKVSAANICEEVGYGVEVPRYCDVPIVLAVRYLYLQIFYTIKLQAVVLINSSAPKLWPAGHPRYASCVGAPGIGVTLAQNHICPVTLPLPAAAQISTCSETSGLLHVCAAGKLTSRDIDP